MSGRTYGYTDPRNYRSAAVPAVTSRCEGVAIAEHRVGYSEITLANGEVIKFHLFIDELRNVGGGNDYDIVYRVVPEAMRVAHNAEDREAEGHA